jgi:formylglycine-generating enzyme
VNRSMYNRWVCGIWCVWLAAMVLCLGNLPCVATADEQDAGEEKGEATAPPLAVAPFDAAAARAHQEAWAKHLDVPVEVTNSIGMKLKLIPPGEFMMGSQETAEELAEAFEAYGKPGAFLFRHEHPRHRVRITRPFYLGVYEVTVGQFGKFVSDTDYKTDAERNMDIAGGFGFNAATGRVELSKGYSWRQVGFPQGDDYPVSIVSHNDALAFCAWLSRKEGQTYRLPTEADWEYSCRAGTTTRYYHGDDPEGLSEVGNVADGTARGKFPNWMTIAGRDGYVFTAPVGKYKPNGFGLFDMHGNVSEWCSDRYGGQYYAKSPVDDPTGPTSGSLRVNRGGGWLNTARTCRSAERGRSLPSWRYGSLGFRVAFSSADQSGR